MSLPSEDIERIRRLPLRDLGYRSPTEFVRDAIRRRLSDLGGPELDPRLDVQSAGRPRRKSGPGAALALAAVLALAMIAVVPDAATAYTPAPVEPDPWIAGNVTVAAQLEGYGSFDYADDAGQRATLDGFAADDRVAEPWNVSWTKIAAPGVLQENAIGTNVWTDPAEWTAATQGTPPTCTLAQDTVDGAGQALRMKAVAAGALGSCGWVFDVDPDLASEDLAKLRLVVGVDVLALSAQNSEIQAEDLGPTQTFRYQLKDTDLGGLGCVNPETSLIATDPGVSLFEQRTLWAPECGSGSLVANSVDKLNVWLQVGAGETAEVRLTALDLRVAAHSLGTRGDGSAATRQTQPMGGGVGLGTFAPTFNVSRAGDVQIAFRQRASALPPERASAVYDDAARVASYRFDFLAPAAGDLAYGTVVAEDELRVDGSQVLEAVWGGEDELFRYDGKRAGDVVRVRDDVAPGALSSLQLTILYSEAEWDQIGGGDGGGIVFPGLRDATTILVLVAGVLVVAYLLLRRFRRRGREDRGDREDRGLDVQTRGRSR